MPLIDPYTFHGGGAPAPADYSTLSANFRGTSNDFVDWSTIVGSTHTVGVISFWLYTTNMGAAQRLIQWRRPTWSTPYQAYINLNAPGGAGNRSIEFRIWNNTVNEVYVRFFGAAITTGQWYDIMIYQTGTQVECMVDVTLQ